MKSDPSVCVYKEEDVERIFLDALPIKAERVLVLRQLLESAAAAEKIAPNAWAVTLFANGFRLNVGQVEALTFFDDVVRVFLHGDVRLEEKVLRKKVTPTTYRSVPQPQAVFAGSVPQFAKVREALWPRHCAYLRHAALSPSGKPRKGTPHARFHTEALMQWARRKVGSIVNVG